MVVVLAILIALGGLLASLVSSSSTTAQDAATRASMTALRNAVLAYYQDMKGIQVGPLNTYPGTTGIPSTLKDLQIQPVDNNGNLVPGFDPYTQKGWRGPYVLQSTGTFLPASSTPIPGKTLDSSFYPTSPVANAYGSPGDLAFLDGWGNPIVLQWPQTGDPVTTRAQYARLVSAGAPSRLVTAQGASYNVSVLDTVAATLMPTQPTTSQPNLANQRGNDYVLFILTQDLYP